MLALPSMASLCFFRTMALNIEGRGGGGQDDPVMGNLLLFSKDEIAILHQISSEEEKEQCTMCSLYSMFPLQANNQRHILRFVS